ncbi:MAG: restriction endonuclease subunit S [Lachnospiraceae bacterium]|nr:restriction endonuclease subunit S [Lachnospiraceae bacterium]
MKVKLGDIAILINGDRGKNYPSQADIVLDGDVPFVNAGHLNGRNINFSEMNYISKEKYAQLNSGKFREGDILYCLRGSLGKKAVVNSSIQGAIASSLVIIRPDSMRVDVDYLMFALDSPSIQEQLIKANNGSSQPNLSAASVRGYEVDLPDKKIQEDIVDKLSKVRAIIDARQQELQKLDDLIKARFVEMFGEPRINPFGFEKMMLKDTCKVITGNTPSRAVEDYYGNYVEWIKTDNIVSGILNPTKASESLSEKGMRVGRIVDANAILMACIAGSVTSIGRVCVTNRTVAFNQQINAVVPEKYNVLFLYTLFQISKDYLVEDINMSLKGILSKSRLEEKEFIVPPMELQNDFANFVEQVDKSKVVIQKALDETQLLFDSLMQKYFG